MDATAAMASVFQVRDDDGEKSGGGDSHGLGERKADDATPVGFLLHGGDGEGICCGCCGVIVNTTTFARGRQRVAAFSRRHLRIRIRRGGR
jgi:hypothetical protein